MNEGVTEFANRLKQGAVATHEGVTLIPLSGDDYTGPSFLTLGEALERGDLVITEVSKGGSVPELRATNKGEIHVFIMDGEELAGAKQNRVLNTSLLLPPGSETVVPVSCTEQGRWASISPEFRTSDNVLFPSARAAKNRSVSESLKEVRGYRSDQGEVWENIAGMHTSQETSSPTGAMRDIYEQRSVELATYEEALPCAEGQIGFAAFINGRLMGVDLVAWAPAWKKLHAKVVRSYAMEARARHRDSGTVPDPAAVGELLQQLSASEVRQFPSLGIGVDLRYEGAGLLGSCLAADGHVIHLALFPRSGARRNDGREDRLASMSRRRSFRQER